MKGEADRAHFERELLHGSDYEIVQCASKNRVFYAAVRTIPTGDVWALVVLMRWTRGPFNFAYKDLDETMGPAEADTPAVMLDALTPTDNDDAQEWRSRCRANLVRRAATRERLRGVADGVVIRTATQLRFEDGMQAQLFRYVYRTGRTIRWHAITDDGTQFPCRLGVRWADRYTWTIVPSGTTDAHAASATPLDKRTRHRLDDNPPWTHQGSNRERGGAA